MASPPGLINPQEVAAKCRKAMKGWGTDEKALTEALVPLTPAAAEAVKRQFAADFSRDLVKDIKSETGGYFETVLVGMLTDPAELDAQWIFKACDGMGTDETNVSRVLCTRSIVELNAIKQAFQRLFGRQLIDYIESEVGGNLQKVYTQLLSRDAAMVAREEAGMDVDADAEALYKAGEGQWGTNEAVFIRRFCTTSRQYRNALYHKYAEKYGKALDAVVKSEMGGAYGKALRMLVTPPDIYLSRELFASMDGMGTSDALLVFLVVSNRWRSLGAACNRFLQDNKKTVAKWVESECGGDYKRSLVAILEFCVRNCNLANMGRALHQQAHA